MPISKLDGKNFGRWLVLRQSHVDKRGYWFWHCRCECGTERTVNGRFLRNLKSRSCGCLWLETITTHGMTQTPTFKSWESMLQRCTNKNSPDYPRYGGAGVTVTKRWYNFENFLADMGERPNNKTLDRYPDAGGNYCSANCRWADPLQQVRNRSNTKRLTYRGTTKTVQEWSKEMGIPYDLLLRRVNRGVSDDLLFASSRSKSVSRYKGVLGA